MYITFMPSSVPGDLFGLAHINIGLGAEGNDSSLLILALWPSATHDLYSIMWMRARTAIELSKTSSFSCTLSDDRDFSPTFRT